MGYDTICIRCHACQIVYYAGNHCNTANCSENPANYPKDAIQGALINIAKQLDLAAANGTPIKCFCGICIECIAVINKEIDDAKAQEVARPWAKCECGSEAVGGPNVRHSSYCPKFTVE
jgi:hypothetical protein